jgi:hypothetical protein
LLGRKRTRSRRVGIYEYVWFALMTWHSCIKCDVKTFTIDTSKETRFMHVIKKTFQFLTNHCKSQWWNMRNTPVSNKSKSK